jgi:ATP-dependent DNA helicase RecG
MPGHMQDAIERLKRWMNELEGEKLEFKEAKHNYDFDRLLEYAVALANEGGGKIILGVSDKRPRSVVGTSAFAQPERTRAGLMEKLPLRIEVEIIEHPQGRVLVFTIPPRPIGVPLQAEGIYLERHGDSLRPMTPEKLKTIFNEVGHDFSADFCPGASMADLDTNAIEAFRKRWIIKSGNQALQQRTLEQILHDAEAITDQGITFAALILFGTRQALGKYLAQAEVIFEYRSSEAAGPAQDRKEYRQGFFGFYEDIWNTINLRNNKQHYQDGLFVYDIPTFEERMVREAVLNAVSHRDYRLGGSVFIRQFSNRLEVVSPGGFPPGINQENILDRQYPRNRRMAEMFGKCGLVERSGQGVNLMFEQAIRHSKLPPDFAKSDEYQVNLTLHGQVQDPKFVNFLEKIAQESELSFTTQDLILLDHIHRTQSIPDSLRSRVPLLIEHGVLESVGRTSGTKYILSKRFYSFVGRKGVYTRKRGLDRNTNKELILKHVFDNKELGCAFNEFVQVLPHGSTSYIQGLLRELKAEGKITLTGRKRWARWYPAFKAQ